MSNNLDHDLIYEILCGVYHYADSAWQHLHETTGVDLLSILTNIANKNEVLQ